VSLVPYAFHFDSLHNTFVRTIVHPVREIIREDGLRLFTEIQEMSHFTSGLAANSPRMPRVMWQDDMGTELNFDGRLISVSSFRTMYLKLFDDTKKMLYEDVLLGLPLPDITHKHIRDDLSNTTVGYSFITDTNNSFHLYIHTLVTAMLDQDTFGTRFAYGDHSNKDGIVWNTDGIQRWFAAAEKCLGNLFALQHYSSQPARGTELSFLATVNTRLHARNVFWFMGLLNFVTTYNKTQTNMNKPRIIARSAPPPLGELFIAWMTFVTPALVAISTCLYSTEMATRFRDLLYTGLGGPFHTDDFSSILMSISGNSVADYGLNHAMGMADTRHFLIALVRKHLRDEALSNAVEEVFNAASGHSDETAELYAISYDSLPLVSDSTLARFVEISRCQHRIIYPLEPTADVSQSRFSGVGKSEAVRPQIDTAAMAAMLAPELATLLAPRITMNIAEGFAAITPIHNPPPILPSLSNVSTSPEAAIGVEVIDVHKVQIHPERYHELERIMGKDARFNSHAQAVALQLAVERKSDMAVVMGTGSGKSLIFMGACINAEETGLATIVVVPLAALLDEMMQRLKDVGIKHMRWINAATTHYNAQIILVSADIAGRNDFTRYYLHGCTQKKIGRLVLDEAQTILTGTHYRPFLSVVKRLREGAVPWIVLSGTMPPSSIGRMLKLLHLLPTATRLIREPTLRPEILHQVFKLTGHHTTTNIGYFDKDGKTQNMITFIQSQVKDFDTTVRALVFCLTKRDAERVASGLHCEYCHSELEESRRKQALMDWKAGKFKVLVATSCLGAGMHYPFVGLVVHYGLPRSTLDYGQESGRGGRKLPRAYSVIFYDPNKPAEPLQDGQDDSGVAEMRDYVAEPPTCRRSTLGASLDGDGKTCFERRTVLLCDVCRGQTCDALQSRSVSI
jgi:superfamily II DNA helicase RecQ